jgi:hypothetical protein
MNNICIFIFSFLFLNVLFAQDNKDFNFQFSIKYNFQDSIPDKKYSFKNNKISFNSSLKDFSGKVTSQKKVKKINKFQVDELLSFCMDNFYAYNKAFVCKTQAVAELSLELILIDKTIQIDYAPCALNKDLIVFKNFDILLDKLLNNK